jgi:hypothetical protein
MAGDSLWEFDFDGWTIGEDAIYILALAEAEKMGNWRRVYPHWARMIVHWPYALNPADLKSYNQLTDDQMRDIITQIEQGIGLSKRYERRTGGGET